eukprot:CAMPEP_0202896064 /NCGR_PEP_ID=MMETSP1392-20130828/5139_1 /ASSEMBLY_ACC=CAM_ASM_000868 /TAXON_ID=225041 /ORGANISM="Chlamydomonas chlamydogama, Strain SAG 11-48b" /LENGTH=47 /DNA_ID= /DNA_START= /DNA_END= /DNA_ORIENTATION=
MYSVKGRSTCMKRSMASASVVALNKGSTSSTRAISLRDKCCSTSGHM